MSAQTQINILPAIETLRELNAWGWNVGVDVSMEATEGIKLENPHLVGLTARRDVPGGTVSISVRATKQSEGIEALAKELMELCSGFRGP